MTFNQVIAQSYRTPHSLEQMQDDVTKRLAAAEVAARGVPITDPRSADLGAELLNAVALAEEWGVLPWRWV
jgi:hypothetical protein